MDRFEGYLPETFGYYMSDNFVIIDHTLSVKEAMREVVRQAGEHDNIAAVFVQDKQHRYLGALDLRDLIVARESTGLATLIDLRYPFVYADEEKDDKWNKLREYGKDIAVLDAQGIMIGVIPVAELMDILEDELEEDYALLAGLAEEEAPGEKLRHSLAKRLPWLALLLVFGLVVSTVIGVFETVIQELTVIVCFQSLILGMAGNTGTQSLAMTVRLVSNTALQSADRTKLVIREMRVGFVGGLILGSLSTLCTALYVWLAQGNGLMFSLSVGGCVGLALCLAMTLSACMGTLVPLTFEKLGLDPAVASGPLITTLGDLFAVVIYYGIAWLLLLR